MIISIFVSLVVLALVVCGDSMLKRHSEDSKEVARRCWPKWIAYFGLTLVVGLLPKTQGFSLLSQIVSLIILVGLMTYLNYWWNEEGSEWGEMVPFVILDVIFFFLGLSLLGGAWFSIIMSTMLIGSIAFIIASSLYFKAKMKERDTGKGASRGGIIAVIIVAVLIWLFLVLGACKVIGLPNGLRPSGDTVTAQAVNDLTVPEVTPEELEELTVSKYDGISWEFLDSSLSPNDKARREQTGFSDALTFGFSATDDAGRFRELEEEILRNPVYGVTLVRAIKDKTIGGQTIGSFNPWMEEMSAKHEQGGVAYWLQKEGETFYVTTEYRCYAATLCTFLERLVPQGVQTRQTTENWCLPPIAENNPRVGEPAPYQYQMEAFVLAYVGKDEGAGTGTAGDGTAGTGASQTDGLFVIGFNIHDKRPEFYGGTPESPSPTVTPSTPSNPSNPDSPSPSPDNPDNPTPTPTPTPDPDGPKYDKDPNDAPDVNTEPNDNPGPGPSTSSGVGSTTSSADTPNSSTSGSYSDYQQTVSELEEINQSQATGGSPNTPSTSSPSGTHVDSTADSGTGHGGIDTPTPVSEPATTASGETISDNPGEAWGGPPD